MKTDFYTKTMLTLIALFLAVLSFDKVYGVAVPEAEAQTKKVEWMCHTAYLRKAEWKANVLAEVANKNGWTFMTISSTPDSWQGDGKEDWGKGHIHFCGY